MAELIAKVNEKLKYWNDIGFIQGELFAHFIYLYEKKLDIIFDKEDTIVRSYRELLSKVLNCKDEHLILMIHCEMENSFRGNKYDNKLYLELEDEAYSHYEKWGKEYPIECLDVHMAMLYGLMDVGEKDSFWRYSNTLFNIFKENFDDNDYTCYRNILYILLKFFCSYLPNSAEIIFERNKQKCVEVMNDDILLYVTQITLGINKIDNEKNIIYLKEKIDECESWIVANNVTNTEIKVFVGAEKGIYYRNIGEKEKSIYEMLRVIKLSDALVTQRYALAQIASIYTAERDWEKLRSLYEQYSWLYNNTNDVDENLAYLYALDAFLKVHEGKREEAFESVKRAINLAEELEGKESELTLIMRNNLSIIYWEIGEIENARKENMDIMEIVMKNPDNYPEAITYIMNNNQVFGRKAGNIDRASILVSNRVIKGKTIKYDKITTYPFKSNFYFLKEINKDISDDEFDGLYDELFQYYSNHKNASGYFEFVRGSVIKFTRERNVEKEIKYLEAIIDYVKQQEFSIYTREVYIACIANAKLLQYKGKYKNISQYADYLWNERILKIMQSISRNANEMELTNLAQLLSAYMGLLISVCRNYGRISDEDLYKYIINYKHLCRMLYKEKEVNVSEYVAKNLGFVKIDKEYLAIDTMGYEKIDFDCPLYIVAMQGIQQIERTHYLFFSFQSIGGLLKHSNIKLLCDINAVRMQEIIDGLKEDELMPEVCDRIRKTLIPLLSGKKRIYLCDNTEISKLIYYFIPIGEGQVLYDVISIVFCRDIQDIVNDICIEDVSNAYVMGKSVFNESENISGKINDYLPDIMYSEKEALTITEILGCNGPWQTFDKNNLKKSGYSIFHFSTHTRINCEGEAELVVGEDNEGKYLTLGGEEISNANWNGVKLVVLSACNTGVANIYEYALSEAVDYSMSKSCISTMYEVDEVCNALFMTCFYKALKSTKKVITSFENAVATLRNITKTQILKDPNYRKLEINNYLESYRNEDRPFDNIDIWGAYVLEIF